MERIILFRFHNALDICVNRLQLLRHFNPGTRIIGLYGGEHETFREAEHILAPYLEYVWEIPVACPRWKWQHGDLSLLSWYRDAGRHVAFDMLHLVEWDLLILASLDEVYGEAGRKGVALTGLTPLASIQHKWHWTTVEPYATQWKQLQMHARETHGWDGPYFASQGPANAFSRAFLERYAQESIPELVHEELRIPLYAQALGFEVTPLAHIYREIQDPEEMKFFNCESTLIKERVIRRALANPAGRRVFHPYKKVFRLQKPWWFF